ncbi:MAG TPA: pyridoxal-dependent decarboxylase [Planctomycetota bacterium]|nr:pyridoxal-dependent decarboxylase [Planctomycetota bacterium]
MNRASNELALLQEALSSLEKGFAHLPEFGAPLDSEKMRATLLKVAEKLRDNFPYHHPLYIGQMIKPPHPVARMAYALAQHINPNNHALDGGRASSAMEQEAVAKIARMFGWDEHLGHLCGGGTMANFEALWIARESCRTGFQAHPEPRPRNAIAASSQAHYTHARLSSVLAVPYREIAVDARGRMNVAALEAALKRGEIGAVVVTLGTTATGSIDPLAEVLALRKRFDFRIHVDAAYGGYFTLARNLDADTRAAFDCIAQADSIVVDPHKHGLQPYGCGCVLFRDPSVGRFYRHDSPYTYFTSADTSCGAGVPPARAAETAAPQYAGGQAAQDDAGGPLASQLHLGEISLECSRPGAAAVALWATLEMLPLEAGGEFARGLEAGREAALALYDALKTDERFAPIFAPELDIVVWAVRAESASESSARARKLFDAAARRDLHLALASIPRAMVEPSAAIAKWDADAVTCLRACVMKAEHREWMTAIMTRLRDAADSM